LLEKICIHITHGYLSKMSFRILLSTAKMQIGTKYIKETLNAFTPTRVLLFFLFFECILSGRGIQNDRGEAGEREQRRFRTKMDKSRGKKMAGGDGYTSQKWLGQWHRQRGQLKSVSNIVASVLLVVLYTPSSNFKSHLLLSKDKICDASFHVLFF